MIGMIFAQQMSPEIICSASGRIQNSTIKIDWVIGESVTATMQNTNNQLSSGFGQPQYLITAINPGNSSFSFFIYPNPTIDKINICSSQNSFDGKYEIWDNIGRLQLNGICNAELAAIDCSKLEKGVYFLILKSNNSDFERCFKIVKQ